MIQDSVRPSEKVLSVFLKPKFLMVLLFFLSSFILFHDLGKGSLWEWDEAIYASVAKEMVADGDYLSLHLNGHYWPEKPPLIIWCIGVTYNVFGINEFSARLPAAIFSLLSVLLIYFIGERFFNHWVGLVSGLFLITNLHFLIVSRTAMLDAPMTFFISAALLLFWLGQEKPIYFIFSGIAIGLAVMAKGLVGFFPLPIIFFYILLCSRYVLLKKPLFWALSIIALLIPIPWHIHQVLTHGQEFIQYYFNYNLFARATRVIEGHSGTVFYYIKYVFEHFFTPWLCLSFVVLLSSGLKLFYSFREKKYDPIYFLLIWFLIPLLFFSLAKTKVAGYVIPCYIPLALITAKLSLDHLQHFWFKIVFAVFLIITLVEAMLFHPLQMITIDKSPEVKEIAAIVQLQKHPLVAYNIPPNAPSFYFNVPVMGMGDLHQFDSLFSQTKGVYILYWKNEFQQIQTSMQGKYKFIGMAISRNGKIQLAVVEQI
jgi:4-amino-4-deoxy-L-arabinose transferase-like glycosyltransferase